MYFLKRISALICLYMLPECSNHLSVLSRYNMGLKTVTLLSLRTDLFSTCSNVIQPKYWIKYLYLLYLRKPRMSNELLYLNPLLGSTPQRLL
jgi:hypothetical protein